MASIIIMFLLACIAIALVGAGLLAFIAGVIIWSIGTVLIVGVIWWISTWGVVPVIILMILVAPIAFMVWDARKLNSDLHS